MKDTIYNDLKQHGLIFDAFITNDDNIKAIEQAAEIMINGLNSGNKILACGNGGSMSDAMHFAGELVGKYRHPRPALAAMALSDQGTITCISNDFGYNEVFSRQVEAIGRSGDVLLALSTSGKSSNVLGAAETAQRAGIKVVSITGAKGWLQELSDCHIEIPHFGTADRIQELTILVLHILVNLIEKRV